MRLLSTFLLLTAILTAADNDFGSLVRQMESHYGTKKVYIPMLGFANFLVKVARPAGTNDFRLAVFEDVSVRSHPSPEEIDERVRPQGWKPFVRVSSNHKQERVHVYSRPSFRDHELLLTVFDRNDAVLIRVRLNPQTLSKWVNNPIVLSKMKGSWDSD